MTLNKINSTFFYVRLRGTQIGRYLLDRLLTFQSSGNRFLERSSQFAIRKKCIEKLTDNKVKFQAPNMNSKFSIANCVLEHSSAIGFSIANKP